MRAVAAVPAVGLLAGAALGLLLSKPPYVAAGVAAFLATALALWAWRAGRSESFVVAIGAAFLFGGVLLSGVTWQRAWRPPLREAFERSARVERAELQAEGHAVPEDDEAAMVVAGVLRADASRSASSVSLSLDVDDPAVGGVLLTVVGSLAVERVGEWRAGRRMRVPAQLRRASRYLDPGVPDFERALARRGATLVGTVKSAELVEVQARGSRVAEAAGDVRAFSRRAIDRSVGRWSSQSAAIVTAIVIGDRAGLDDEVQRRLQEAGTYHVIAISGGNIAILAGLMLGAYRLAGVLGRTAMLSSIAALVGYAYLVGGGASVDRATLMAVIVFAGRALDQRSPALNTLAVTAAVLVAFEPLAVADPAFILTCGATLAILSAIPVAAAPRFGRWLGPLVAMFVASLAAEALLFPVSALVFSRVTFAGLALNFLAIPLMGIAQVAGMLVIPLALVSGRAAMAVGWVASFGATGLVRSADLLQLASLASYRVAPPAAGAVGVYYVALSASWFLWRRKVTRTGSGEGARARLGRRTGVAFAALAAGWILLEPWAWFEGRGDGRLHVTFVDVGQGDSAFVRFPRGSSMLVDAGGLSFSSGFDIGDRVVAPVLREAGVRRLDIVALSHGDPDHVGGASAILREFRPAEVWEGIPVPRFEPLSALRLQAQSAGGRWANVYAGDRLVIDDVAVTAWHPSMADWERQRVRNDDSLVLELRWRDVSFLLTGDIGRPVERLLASAIPRAPLRVIKVPHHGSLTSSTPEFLRAVQPRIAVVSAGRGNHFGHPVPEVLERYRAAGAELFRTDQDGAVTADSDGWSVDVHSFTGRTYRTTAATPTTTTDHHEGTKNTKNTKR